MLARQIQVWSSRGAAPAAESARERQEAAGVCAGDDGAAGVCAGEDVWSDDWRRDFCADLPNLSDARLWGRARDKIACVVGRRIEVYSWANLPQPRPPPRAASVAPATPATGAAAPPEAAAPVAGAAGGATAAPAEPAAAKMRCAAVLRLEGHARKIACFDVGRGGESAERAVSVSEDLEVRFWEGGKCVRVAHLLQQGCNAPAQQAQACCCCCCASLAAAAGCVWGVLCDKFPPNLLRKLPPNLRTRLAAPPTPPPSPASVRLLSHLHYSADLLMVRLVSRAEGRGKKIGAVLSTGCHVWLI